MDKKHIKNNACVCVCAVKTPGGGKKNEVVENVG